MLCGLPPPLPPAGSPLNSTCPRVPAGVILPERPLTSSVGGPRGTSSGGPPVMLSVDLGTGAVHSFDALAQSHGPSVNWASAVLPALSAQLGPGGGAGPAAGGGGLAELGLSAAQRDAVQHAALEQVAALTGVQMGTELGGGSGHGGLASALLSQQLLSHHLAPIPETAPRRSGDSRRSVDSRRSDSRKSVERRVSLDRTAQRATQGEGQQPAALEPAEPSMPASLGGAMSSTLGMSWLGGRGRHSAALPPMRSRALSSIALPLAPPPTATAEERVRWASTQLARLASALSPGSAAMLSTNLNLMSGNLSLADTLYAGSSMVGGRAGARAGGWQGRMGGGGGSACALVVQRPWQVPATGGHIGLLLKHLHTPSHISTHLLTHKPTGALMHAHTTHPPHSNSHRVQVIPVVPEDVFEHTIVARPNFDNKHIPRSNYMYVNALLCLALHASLLSCRGLPHHQACACCQPQ